MLTPFLRRLRDGNWPFAPARWPFFYGWVIACTSTLGILMSIPGQTMGVAVFTDSFIEAFGLSRTQLSTAYMLGTIGSALFLTYAGRLYDRFGGRTMVVMSSFGLAILIFLTSQIDIFGSALHNVLGISVMFINFVLIFLAYFGIRFFGQGVLTSASRNTLVEWFDKKRGRANSFSSIFVSLGFSLSPLLLANLIIALGWRGALWFLAAMIGVFFVVIAVIFIRDKPESAGLLPDGVKSIAEAGLTIEESHEWTLQKARRTLRFWLYSLSLAMHALTGTAFTFHVTAIFVEAGRDRADAFEIFFPTSIISVTTNFAASWLSDYIPLGIFIKLMLPAFMLMAWSVVYFSEPWAYWTLILGMGLGGGLWGVIANLSWVKFYGRRHLGSITGFNASVMVFMSAIGPAFFSLSLDTTASFAAAAWACFAAYAALFLLSFRVKS